MNISKKTSHNRILSSSPTVGISKHPVLKGLRSLGTIGGRMSDYTAYLKRSNTDDMNSDWTNVGMSLRISISQFNK